jgi:hypothetical protein
VAYDKAELDKLILREPRLPKKVLHFREEDDDNPFRQALRVLFHNKLDVTLLS